MWARPDACRQLVARVSVSFLLAVLGGACDQSAKAVEGGGPIGKLSGEYETCSSSQQCDGELRCIDGTCRSSARSVLGDYYAALGARMLTEGDVGRAVEAYIQAVNQYEADKVAPPVELYCSQGRALTEARSDPQKAELAARVLHRCLMGAPAGSRVRDRALADLAILADSGLDPLLLARDEQADLYLTKAPTAPSTDELKISAKGDLRTSRRSYTAFEKLLNSDEVLNKLAPCWLEHWKSTHETALSVTLPFHYSFRLDEYDDFDRSTLAVADFDPPSDDAEAAAARCFAEALNGIADEYSKTAGEARWKANFTISLDN